MPTVELLERIEVSVGEAVRVSLQEFTDGRTGTEPALTDRIAARVSDALNALDGVTAEVRTLRDKGAGAAEREFGADLAVRVTIVGDEDTIAKLLLAQAKKSKTPLTIAAASPDADDPGERGVVPRSRDEQRRPCP